MDNEITRTTYFIMVAVTLILVGTACVSASRASQEFRSTAAQSAAAEARLEVRAAERALLRIREQNSELERLVAELRVVAERAESANAECLRKVKQLRAVPVPKAAVEAAK